MDPCTGIALLLLFLGVGATAALWAAYMAAQVAWLVFTHVAAIMAVLAVEAFVLHRGPERFDERVVDAKGDATHGAEQARCTETVSEYPGPFAARYGSRAPHTCHVNPGDHK